MKNAIRCCIACILPCGALDVIRIVHTNGKVEELSGNSHVKAAEIMKLHPKHVLKKPSSLSSLEDHEVVSSCPKIVIVPPDAELQRGKIYFLMPVMPSSSTPHKNNRSSTRKKKITRSPPENNGNNAKASCSDHDQYLSEILSEKISTQRDRRRGRVAVWRPHLESISETDP